MAGYLLVIMVTLAEHNYHYIIMYCIILRTDVTLMIGGDTRSGTSRITFLENQFSEQIILNINEQKCINTTAYIQVTQI